MATPLHKLNARFAETTKEPGRHGDGGGLYLSITPKGARRWVFLFRWRGKLTEMGLGSADVGGLRYKSLSAAREEAARQRALIAAGLNPLEETRRQEAVAAEVPTFGKMADEHIAAMTPRFRNPKHVAQWETTLGKTELDLSKVRPELKKATQEHVTALAVLRTKKVDAIDTADVLRVLQPIWQVKAETASRVRGRIEAVLDAAKAKGHRSGENPARWRGHLDKLLAKRHKLTRGHHAAMPYDEVAAFVERLRNNGSVSSLALEFAILTAGRTGEVIGARWREVDFDRAIWVVPASRMKAGKEHRVPLSKRALAILEALKPIAKDGDSFVFPGNKGAGLSPMSLQMVLRRAKVDATPHGFRSSFRDWAGDETGFAHQDIEAALAHTISNKAEAAYRRSDALEKRRALMQAWASYIEPGEATANIVTLRKSAGVSR